VSFEVFWVHFVSEAAFFGGVIGRKQELLIYDNDQAYHYQYNEYDCQYNIDVS
jgi:hypothetical protein